MKTKKFRFNPRCVGAKNIYFMLHKVFTVRRHKVKENGAISSYFRSPQKFTEKRNIKEKKFLTPRGRATVPSGGDRQEPHDGR